jgi:hypothetical protein
VEQWSKKNLAKTISIWAKGENLRWAKSDAISGQGVSRYRVGDVSLFGDLRIINRVVSS